MQEEKITKEFIIKVLEKWLKKYKAGILPLSYEAVQQLYEVLTEEQK